MALRYDGKTETDDLEEKIAFDHRNDGGGLQNSISRVVGQDAVDAAKEGTQAQQNMTSMDALRRYPVATAFSILYSTAIVMEGYDLVVINSFYGQPQFQRYVSLDFVSVAISIGSDSPHSSAPTAMSPTATLFRRRGRLVSVSQCKLDQLSVSLSTAT